MAKKIKDTDYLALSARIRALETRLLGRDQMDRLLDSQSPEELEKALQEHGYPPLDPRRRDELDAALIRVREETLSDLSGGVPDTRLLDCFRIQYDYHNVKAILKAEAMGVSPERMFFALGRISPEDLEAAVRESDWDSLPGKLGAAAAEARETFETTRDPQLLDAALDRWCYQDMLEAAEETGSAFLAGYVRNLIDSVNLRTLVRTLRIGKSPEFLKGVLLDGGEIEPDAVLHVSAAGGAGLADLYGATPFSAAAEAGAEALQGGALTAFEKLCDEAAGEYLGRAQFVPFGEEVLIGYLAARETEYQNLRILLLGWAAGLPAEVIRSRLRAGNA